MVGSTMQPKTGNACAAPSEAKTSPWQEQASAKPSPTSTSPGQAALIAPSSSSPSHRLRYSSSQPCLHLPLRLRSPDGSERRSWHVPGSRARQFKATLSSAGITKGGNCGEHAAEKEKEKGMQPAKDSPSGFEEGGRRTGTGWSCCSSALTPYLLLRSPSARSSSVSPARHSKLRQHRHIVRPGVCRC